jgi:hypothetical protein
MSALALSPAAILAPAPDPARSEDALRWEVEELASPDTSLLFDEFLEQQQALLAVITDAPSTIRTEAFSQAISLLASLPTDIPSPEISVEDDGRISFDWHLARDRALSLNVGRGGMLGYAALIGPKSTYGRLPFVGTLDQTILALLAALPTEEPPPSP